MGNLTAKVAPSQFEIMGAQIAAIIALELSGQFAMYSPAELTADPKQNVLNAPVFHERAIPMTIDEKELVNVQLAFGDFEGVRQLLHLHTREESQFDHLGLSGVQGS